MLQAVQLQNRVGVCLLDLLAFWLETSIIRVVQITDIRGNRE